MYPSRIRRDQFQIRYNRVATDTPQPLSRNCRRPYRYHNAIIASVATQPAIFNGRGIIPVSAVFFFAYTTFLFVVHSSILLDMFDVGFLKENAARRGFEIITDNASIVENEALGTRREGCDM